MEDIMKKKILTGILAGVLAIGTLTGCGNSGTDAAAENQAAANETAAGAESAQATEHAADAVKEGQPEAKGTITVAASATPHAEILEQAKAILAEQGWDLEVTVFDDYVQPNEVVESGEFDANYFQHIPYLEDFNETKGTHLVNAGGIHYEPFGIYPGTKKDLSELAKGDVIAVPNDTTNEARALLLLQANGVITLRRMQALPQRSTISWRIRMGLRFRNLRRHRWQGWCRRSHLSY